MAGSVPNIPSNAVQVLFAEDLVSRILYHHNGLQYETWRAGPYRHFIFNGFNDVIKRAVDFIDKSLEWEVDEEFSTLVDAAAVNEMSFVNYALRYKYLYFAKGFDPDYFFDYCVRLVSLAACFAQHNVPTAPDLALCFIVKVFDGYDLFEGGWDTLNSVAKKYVKINEDSLNVLTPEVSDDDSLSDSSDEEMDLDEVDRDILSGDFLVNNQLQVPEESVLAVEDISPPEEGIELESFTDSASEIDSCSGQALGKVTASSEQFLDSVEDAGKASKPNGKVTLPIMSPDSDCQIISGRGLQEIIFTTNGKQSAGASESVKLPGLNKASKSSD